MRRICKTLRGCLIVVFALVVLSVVGLLLPDTDEPTSDSAQMRSQNTATDIPPRATSISPTATSGLPTATSVPPTATSIPPTSLSFPVTRLATPLNRYTHGQVNLREEPGTSFNLASSVPAGSSIEFVGESGDWYLIKHNGREVYIASWLTFERHCHGLAEKLRMWARHHLPLPCKRLPKSALADRGQTMSLVSDMKEVAQSCEVKVYAVFQKAIKTIVSGGIGIETTADVTASS